MSKADSRPAEEMSMEDILASIRKMIAQDQDVMDTTRADRDAGLPSEEPTADDEVLDLVEELPEDGVVVDRNATPPDAPPAWDEPPSDDIAEMSDGQADEALDLDTAFAIDDDIPPPVDTAAAQEPSEENSWGPIDSRPPSQEPILVGLEIQATSPEFGEAEPDMRDTPRFIDESQQTVAEIPTLDAPDDSVIEPEAAAGAADTVDDMAQTPHEEVVAMDAPQERILSPEAAVKTSAAFDALAQTLISGYDGEANTLEGVVRAMLKPLLKEWLDANLPKVVEEIVQAEIRRLSR